MKNTISWNVIPCSLVCVYQLSEGMYCLRLQNWRVSQETNKNKFLLLGLILKPEDRSCTLLRNVGKRLLDYMMLHFRIEYFLKSCLILIHKLVVSTKTSHRIPHRITSPRKVSGNSTKSFTAQASRNRFLLFSIFNYDDVRRGPPMDCWNSCDKILFFCLYLYECQCSAVVTLPANGKQPR
jgi:hypothetical protein